MTVTYNPVYHINGKTYEMEVYIDGYSGNLCIRLTADGKERSVSIALDEEDAEEIFDRFDYYLSNITDEYAAEVERRGYVWEDEAQDYADGFGTKDELFDLSQWAID